MTLISKSIRLILTFSFGVAVGSLGLGIASADETPAPVTTATEPQGEILSVCIEKKTGVIRAASSCKKTERATTLGGVGPKGAKGDKGDTGLTGAQGLRGLTGLTGATGSISGLRTQSIKVWEQGYSLYSSCDTMFGFAALNGKTTISISGNTVSLNKSCSTLNSSTITVYTP